MKLSENLAILPGFLVVGADEKRYQLMDYENQIRNSMMERGKLPSVMRDQKGYFRIQMVPLQRW